MITWKKTYKAYKPQISKDKEGCENVSWIGEYTIDANIYPASGKAQAEQYGMRLTYILNMLCYDTGIEEGDALCVYDAEKPDYKVISIKQYSDHLLCELEKMI